MKKPTHKKMVEMYIDASENYMSAVLMSESQDTVNSEHLAAVSVGVMHTLENYLGIEGDAAYNAAEEARDYLIKHYGEKLSK